MVTRLREDPPLLGSNWLTRLHLFSQIKKKAHQLQILTLVGVDTIADHFFKCRDRSRLVELEKLAHTQVKQSPIDSRLLRARARARTCSDL